ncbi:MAG: hypothetical protein ACLP8B_26920 [Xanthobacteraceae bacterium]
MKTSTSILTHVGPTRMALVLRRRGALIVAGLVILAAGLAIGWPWLSAIGAAPILISLAPCAAMCALGLCMHRMTGKSCAGHGQEHSGTPPSDTAKSSAMTLSDLSRIERGV